MTSDEIELIYILQNDLTRLPQSNLSLINKTMKKKKSFREIIFKDIHERKKRILKKSLN